MLYLAAEYLTRFVSGFNLFTYITMRAILAALTALVISLLLGPGLIRRLQARKIGQTVRNDGPGTHLPKAGTPTMGGTLILLAIAAGTLLWGDPRSPYLWTVQGVTLAYLVLLVLLPLVMVPLGAAKLSSDAFWAAVTSPRAVASYRLSFGASVVAARARRGHRGSSLLINVFTVYWSAREGAGRPPQGQPRKGRNCSCAGGVGIALKRLPRLP